MTEPPALPSPEGNQPERPPPDWADFLMGYPDDDDGISPAGHWFYGIGIVVMMVLSWWRGGWYRWFFWAFAALIVIGMVARRHQHRRYREAYERWHWQQHHPGE